MKATIFAAAIFTIFGVVSAASCEESCQDIGNNLCCEVDGCCYECSEGSDADCAPEVRADL
jgi:hypothetical protein